MGTLFEWPVDCFQVMEKDIQNLQKCYLSIAINNRLGYVNATNVVLNFMQL